MTTEGYNAEKLAFANRAMAMIELLPPAPPALWRPVLMARWLRDYRRWRQGGAVTHSLNAYGRLQGSARQAIADRGHK